MLLSAELTLAQAYQQWLVQGTQLVDIRAIQHFAAVHVAGALCLSQGNEFETVHRLPPDTPILVMCYHGISSQRVVTRLLHQGFLFVYNVQGGFERWATSYPETLVRQLLSPSNDPKETLLC